MARSGAIELAIADLTLRYESRKAAGCAFVKRAVRAVSEFAFDLTFLVLFVSRQKEHGNQL